MMMIGYYVLTKLKTKTFVYEKVYSSNHSDFMEYAKELSSKRRAIKESIKQATAREMPVGVTSRFQQCINKLEQYLPLLENFVDQQNEVEKHPTDIPNLPRWSSALASSSSSSVFGPKFYQVNDINFELGMILSLYGAALGARALELSSSDLVQSATLFRQAAGVYDYLSQKAVVSGRLEDKLPEASPCVSSVMSIVCLAEAQAVTARKAAENGNTCSLLAKLHHGVTEFLAEAASMLQAAKRESKDVSRLMDYISSCKALHKSKSHHYTAECLKSEGKIGTAVRVVRQALLEMKESMPREESWRPVFRQAMDDLTEVIRKYEHENDFVWYDKVPFSYEVDPPQARKIATLVPYQPQKLERSFKLH